MFIFSSCSFYQQKYYTYLGIFELEFFTIAFRLCRGHLISSSEMKICLWLKGAPLKEEEMEVLNIMECRSNYTAVMLCEKQIQFADKQTSWGSYPQRQRGFNLLLLTTACKHLKEEGEFSMPRVFHLREITIDLS